MRSEHALHGGSDRFIPGETNPFRSRKSGECGGVSTSGLEMSQNAQHISWSASEVDAKLREIMKNIYQNCYRTSVRVGHPGNLVIGANIAGFLKVYDAMKAQGII